jgi:predicted dithiol-disulfide oxidoreductase (DUF899 family)
MTVVSKQEWLVARKELLAKEKQLTKERDDIARLRRELPRVKVEKDYVFEGPNGKQSLSDLFAGRSQLIVYHFMFGPEWTEGCPSCSMLGDSVDGFRMHLEERDVSFVVVSRAPLAKIEEFRTRMGWKFKWLSSYGSDFNYDFNVSFSKEEAADGKMYYNYDVRHFPADEGPGASVFVNEGNGVFHTYSTYARGLEQALPVYTYLDLVPKGRDEAGLPHPMAWVRHHDKYESLAAEAHCCEAHS